MTKVNPNNGTEIKSDIFPWGIFKSDVFFLSKNISVSVTFKTKLSQFYG